jgi:hypothetical protein
MQPTRRKGLRTALGRVLLLLLVPASAGAISFAHTAAAVGNTPGVAVVGDSLAWQANASIDSALSHLGYPERVSVDPGHALSSSWTQRQLKNDLQEKRFGIIVIETASNDSFQIARANESVPKYSELLEGLLQAAAGRCVVVVNAKVDVTPYYYPRGDALALNRVISRTALKYSNERIVGWNQEARTHQSWFRTDLLHFTSATPNASLASDPPPSSDQSAGDKAFAQAIVAGVQSCQVPRTSGTAIE